MFAVYDNNKPAIIEMRNNWKKYKYDTFDEAVIYAADWLGEWDCIPKDWDGSPLDYNGMGDLIEIRNET